MPSDTTSDSLVAEKTRTRTDTSDTAPDSFMLRTERLGDLEINLEGRKKEGLHTTYIIRVTGTHGTHVVHRRYKEFEELHREMFGNEIETTEAQAAAMPPKSFFFRRTFSSKFRAKRQSGLGEVMKGAFQAASDSYVDSCPPALRRFLALDQLTPAESAAPEPAVSSAATPDAESATAESAIQDAPSAKSPAVSPRSSTAATEDAGNALAQPAVSPRSSAAATEDAGNALAEAEQHSSDSKKIDEVYVAKSFTESSAGATSATAVNAEPEPEAAVTEEVAKNISQPEPKERVPAIYKLIRDGADTCGPSGLYYRQQKIIDDDTASKMGVLTTRLQQWGTFVAGLDDGDGFLKVEDAGVGKDKASVLYLPMSLWGRECIVLANEAVPAYYRLHCTHLRCSKDTPCLGLQYRKSMDIDDCATLDNGNPKGVAWDTVVCGVCESDAKGNSWLRVDDLFLPMAIDDSRVITVKSLQPQEDVQDQPKASAPKASAPKASAPEPGPGTEGYFRVHTTHYRCCKDTPCAGLMYRNSMNLDDHATWSDGNPRGVRWESVVCGVCEEDNAGNAWLRVDGRYLPMALGDSKVITLKSLKGKESGCFACLPKICSS